MEEKEYEKPILLKDLGTRFPTENSKERKKYGLYECFCGEEFEAIVNNVERGKQKSCGCLKGQKHKLSSHRLYQTWKDMMYRCHNSKNKYYKYYGGRGITVCERWHLTENFIEDMFPSFEEGLSLDRIDVDGNYEPNNCRWVTKAIQSCNTKLIRANNKSGFRGVCWSKVSKKWSVELKFLGKKIYLGLFNTAVEGAIAYNNYVIENNLEHPLNIIPESV